MDSFSKRQIGIALAALFAAGAVGGVVGGAVQDHHGDRGEHRMKAGFERMGHRGGGPGGEFGHRFGGPMSGGPMGGGPMLGRQFGASEDMPPNPRLVMKLLRNTMTEELGVTDEKLQTALLASIDNLKKSDDINSAQAKKLTAWVEDHKSLLDDEESSK